VRGRLLPEPIIRRTGEAAATLTAGPTWASKRNEPAKWPARWHLWVRRRSVAGGEHRLGDRDRAGPGRADAVDDVPPELLLVPLDHAHQGHRRHLAESAERELDH